MAVVNTTKTICDVCGDDTDGFYYYETHTNTFGVIAETSLWIDTCEVCAKAIQYDIPNKLLKDRYDREEPDKGTLEKLTQELKNKIEDVRKHNDYYFGGGYL